MTRGLGPRVIRRSDAATGSGAERDHAKRRLHRTAALFACFAEIAMPTKFRIIAMVAALAAGTSSAAMAQYACAPGYTYVHGVCQPVRSPGYSNPASGAVSGEAAGAASGYATGGPVGGAIGTATRA